MGGYWKDQGSQTKRFFILEEIEYWGPERIDDPHSSKKLRPGVSGVYSIILTTPDDAERIPGGDAFPCHYSLIRGDRSGYETRKTAQSRLETILARDRKLREMGF